MPRWSSDSSTSIARWPCDSSRTSSLTAPAGQRTCHAAASTSSASRSSVERDSGTSRWAATRAARRTIVGSVAGSARDVSSTARSTTTSPSPTRSSCPSWWRDMCRHAPSAIHPIVRAAAATSAMRSSADAAPMADADGVLVLEPQHVAGSPGHAVEGDADVDEAPVALVEHGEVVGGHEQVGVGRPPQRLHVAEPAVAVLEVGLEEEGDIAGLGPSLDHLRAQGVEPAPTVAAPAGAALRRQPGRQLLVAGQVADAQRRRRRVEVVAGEGELVVERPHGMAELEPGVPQRVPQRRRRLADPADLAVVDEEHVDVALRRQLATAVAADGDEGHRRALAPGGDAGRRLSPQRAEHLVGRPGEGPAQRPPRERRVGDERVACRVDGRSRARRSHPCRVGHGPAAVSW